MHVFGHVLIGLHPNCQNQTDSNEKTSLGYFCYVFLIFRPESEQPCGPFQPPLGSAGSPDGCGLTPVFWKAPRSFSRCPAVTMRSKGRASFCLWSSMLRGRVRGVTIKVGGNSTNKKSKSKTFSKTKCSASLEASFSLLVSLAKSRWKRNQHKNINGEWRKTKQNRWDLLTMLSASLSANLFLKASLCSDQTSDSLCGYSRSQKWIIPRWHLLCSSCLLLPAPHIHPTLWGGLEGCDLCYQTSLSFLAASPAVVRMRLRDISTAASPEEKTPKCKK